MCVMRVEGAETKFFIKILSMMYRPRYDNIQSFRRIQCPKCSNLVTIVFETLDCSYKKEIFNKQKREDVMATKLTGKTLLTADRFPKLLDRVAGGLTGDIKIEDDLDAPGYYIAHATVRKMKVSTSGAVKISNALTKLTGIQWGYQKKNGGIYIFNTQSFTRKQLMSAIKTNPAQKELNLKLKKTPLGKSCDTWIAINAKLKRCKAELQAQGKKVLEEMRKEGRDTLAIDSITFERTIVAEREELRVKGK